MSDLSVRTSLADKLRRLVSAVRSEGVTVAVRRASKYVRYQLVNKRQFLFFVSAIDGSPLLGMKTPANVTVRQAMPADLPRIRAEIFPQLVGDLEYERRYFDRLGAAGLVCFIAETGGRLVHYSWVFIDASQSIIRDVSFDRRQLQPGDAFIGPVFTAPDARGLVYLHVLADAMKYLKTLGSVRRLLLFIDASNTAAPPFYLRLGFTQLSPKLSDRIPKE